jgi:hypothetical protein
MFSGYQFTRCLTCANCHAQVGSRSVGKADLRVFFDLIGKDWLRSDAPKGFIHLGFPVSHRVTQGHTS